MRRLWALDTLVGAVRNAGVPAMRTPDAVARLVAFLALHAFGDVSVPAALLEAAAAEEAATAAAATATGTKASGKRQRAVPPPNPHVAALRSLLRAVSILPPATGSLAEGASLLVADPPISEPLREELRARLLTLLHELPKMQLLAAAGSADSSGASGGRRGNQKRQRQQQGPGGAAGGAPAPPLAGAPPAERVPAWGGCEADRASAALEMQGDLTALVQGVWASASEAAALTAPSEDGAAAAAETAPASFVVTTFPAAADLASAASDSDSEDEDDDADASDADDDEDEEVRGPGRRTALVPAAVRSAALAAAAALRTVAAAVLRHGLAPAAATAAGGRQRIVESARQLLAYGALLNQGALTLLLDPADAGAAAAVADVVACAPALQADAISRATAALAAAAATASAPAPVAATPSKKGRAAAPPALPPSAAAGGAAAATAAAEARAAADSLPGIAAPFASGAAAGASPSDCLLVLVDAALALLSGAGATVREVVKAALRPLFRHVTPAIVQSILTVITASREDDDEGDNEDADT
jgi:hypothetical protein